ncbi:MAG: AI-2E family transporter [Anaerolineales bacterium]|jgi:predicted PurR-regulated permease PerM
MPVKPENQWGRPVRYLIFGLVCVLLALTVWSIRRVLEPLIIAAFIAYLINPMVNYLTGFRHMTRRSAVNLVYFVTLAVLIALPATLARLYFDEYQEVVTDAGKIVNQVIFWLTEPHILSGIPLDFSQLADQLTQFRTTFLTSLPGRAITLLGRSSLDAIYVLVILVAVYYFMSEWPRLREGFIGSFPEPYHQELNELYQRLRLIWISYLRGQLTLMIMVGVAFTIAWTLIGLPGALVLGVLSGLLTLIPDVGPFLAAALAFFVAILEGSNWWPQLAHGWVSLIVLVAYLILISLKNFWIRPVIMGRSVHMHEALVLISILLATVLWGILGALLIIPMLASVVVIGDYLRRRILGMTPFPPAEPFVTLENTVPDSEAEAASSTKKPRKVKG